MTVRIRICVVVLAACAAWAQEGPQGTINDMRRQIKNISNATEQRRQSAASQLGLSAGKSVVPATLTGSSSIRTKSGKATSSATATKPKATTVGKRRGAIAGTKAVATKKEGADPAPEMKASTRSFNMRGQRDPFETIIRSQTLGDNCGTGKKCLTVASIELKGVVRAPSGMIAVVENQQKKTYFLHENDPVFNGQVVKIGPDSVLFRETVTDRAGRRSVKDVVKRLFGSPSA